MQYIKLPVNNGFPWDLSPFIVILNGLVCLVNTQLP